MTSAGVDAPPPAPPSDASFENAPAWHEPPVEEYARWLRRVVAMVLDSGLIGGVAWLAVGDSGAGPSLWPGLFDSHQRTSWALPIALTVLAIVASQAYTGWTPGKLVVGIAVVRDADRRPGGLVRTAARVLAHLLDSILLIGYLRPLWHRERRTFADSICGTLVVLRRPGLPRGQRGALTAAALVLCLLGAGLSTTWSSSSGDRARGEGACLPAEPVDGSPSGHDVARDASVQVSGYETWDEERRLWWRHRTAEVRSYDVTWTWSDKTVPSGDLALDVAVSAPGASEPATTERFGIDGRSSEVTTIASADAGNGLSSAAATVGGRQVSALGRVVDVSTRLLVDGEPVATCTVAGLTLAPIDW